MKNMSTGRLAGRAGIYCAIFSAGLTSSLVHAQSTGLEQIVVTAQKRSQNLQEVPATISAFGAQDIARRGIGGLADIATAVPGVKFNEFSGTGNFSVRGVGTSILSGTGEGAVATNLDGIFLSQTSSLTMVQGDLGSIEVLRGPQSTLYGHNALAGVVNFISAAPSDHFEATASLGHANYDAWNGWAMMTGPLADGVKGRIYFSASRRDGYTINTISGQRLDGLKSLAGRASLDAGVTDWWTSKLRVTVDRDRFTGPTYDPVTPAHSAFPDFLVDYRPRYVKSGVPDQGGQRDLQLVSWRNIFDVGGGVSVTSLSGYSHFRYHALQDVLNFALGAPVHRHNSNNFFSEELNISQKSSRLDWLVGAYVMHDSRKNGSNYDFSQFLPVLGFLDARAKRTSGAVFGDLTYRVTDRFRLFGGVSGQYERTQQNLDNRTQLGVGGPIIVNCSGTTSQKAIRKAVTGRAGAQYDVSDGVMGYVQASRGYKPGGFSETSCDNPYESSKLNAVEAGLKTSLADKRLTIDGAVYYYDYHGIQIEQATLIGIPVVNIPKAHVLGADLELAYRPTRLTRFNLALSVLHSRYDRGLYTDPSLGGVVGTSLAGIRLNNAPAVSGTLGAEHGFQLASDARLTLRGELYATSRYNLREINLPWTVQKGYASLSGFLTYAAPGDRFEVRGWVKNATNQTIRGAVLGAQNTAFGNFLPPRMYGVDVQVNF